MIKIFQDKSELAAKFCDDLEELVEKKQDVYLCLSGGSTPKIIFQTLSKDYKDRINWRKIHLFWSDERCVPPEKEDSNFGMAKKYLINLIDIPEDNVHRLKGEDDPEKEAIRYSQEIKNIVPLKNKLPYFDIIMLGVGEDGHTASIFPNQMQMLESNKVYEVTVHTSTGQKRITLTGKVINNAEKIIFLITGKNKASIIKKILEERNKIFPVEFIRPATGSIDYYLDNEAASLLNKK